VGDIGGTNTRLALYDPETMALSEIANYANQDFDTIDDAIAQWLSSSAGPPPEVGCLAIAAPPFDDDVVMLNSEWRFSLSKLKRRFALRALRGINDFVGNAYALPHLTGDDYQILHEGSPGNGARCATVGPGTGLGGATLETNLSMTHATASEPGHMGLSPGTERELAIFQILVPTHGEVYAERLLSGPGLVHLYRALASVNGVTAAAISPAEISRKALDGTCRLCEETIDVFCALLGSICGDYVLATGSYGGLYLAGGITPKILPRLQDSDFKKRFSAKGEMSSQLKRVPLYAITTPVLGLIGAANAPL
jgi:glucokinase